MKTELLNLLKKNNADVEHIKWIEENKIETLEEAWESCNRGDWLLWMAERLFGVDQRKLTMCAALCAHTVVQHIEDPISKDAVRIAFLFSRSKVTLDEVKEAKAAARAAENTWFSNRAAKWAATAAKWVVFSAAEWGDDAYTTITYAAAAACAAADATYAHAGADAEKKNQRRTAEIAKKMLTDDVLEKIKELNEYIIMK